MRAYLEMVSCLLKNKKGQGLVEYALILALISVVAIAIMTSTGTDIKAVFEAVNTKLTGAKPL